MKIVTVKIALAILVIASVSCTSTSGLINFEAMIPEDLAIYNEGLELDEQVVCQPAHSDGVNQYFKLNNPKEVSQCGCGVSVQFN
jgi:hypothetical protein